MLITGADVQTNPFLLFTPVLGVLAAITWGVLVHRRALRHNRELATELQRSLELKNAAEQASHAKDEFLARVSHEIRIPLKGVLEFVTDAQGMELADGQKRSLDAVLNSAEWLTKILGQVLEFNRLEATRPEPERHKFSISACVHRAVETIEREAAEKNLVITEKSDPRLPAIVSGDERRLLQVIGNLLENAVRATSSGRIIVTTELEHDGREDLVFSVAVADTGTGIAPEKHATIFEPYQGGVRMPGKLASGAGLGLSICKKLVESMDGSIEVQSQVGAGSTFRFSARMRKVMNQAELEQKAEMLATLTPKRLSVLLVDPDAVARRTHSKMLESAGHQIRPAASAADMITAFSMDIFDVVVIDTGIGQREAFQGISNLRSLESGIGRTPIFALGGGWSLLASMNGTTDGTLQKPLEVNDLLRLVTKLELVARDPDSVLTEGVL